MALTNAKTTKQTPSRKTAEQTLDAAKRAINPTHYKAHPSGVECIKITQHYTFCLGNVIKYIWRAGIKGGKGQELLDLKKARWYLDREIKLLEVARKSSSAGASK